MIQVHVDILQNLQQVLFVLDIPSSADCGIRTDEIVIDDDGDQHQGQTTIDLHGLVIDVTKGAEVLPANTQSDTTGNRQVRRTFKFPLVTLPTINDAEPYDLHAMTCAECRSTCKLLTSTGTFRILQEQNTNADDINEVIYCHRFCDAHPHEHKEEYQSHAPVDLHADLSVLETTGCFIVAKEHVAPALIHNQSIQCDHCSSRLGSIDPQNNLVSLDKCQLIPFSNDYLSSCFRHHEAGRYIVKVAKYNDVIFLLYLLPNQIISGTASVDPSSRSAHITYRRRRKVLVARVTSSDNALFTDWKRDFSVTTLLVNRPCLEHLSSRFQDTIHQFPNLPNSDEPFQSLTMSL